MDFEQVLNQLGMILPQESFKLQPQTAFKELIDLEKKYNINTSDLLEKKIDISNIPIFDQDNWVNSLETYVTFDGEMRNLDTILPAFHVKDNYITEEYVESSKNEIKDEYTKKEEVNPYGFTSSFFKI